MTALLMLVMLAAPVDEPLLDETPLPEATASDEIAPPSRHESALIATLTGALVFCSVALGAPLLVAFAALPGGFTLLVGSAAALVAWSVTSKIGQRRLSLRWLLGAVLLANTVVAATVLATASSVAAAAIWSLWYVTSTFSSGVTLGPLLVAAYIVYVGTVYALYLWPLTFPLAFAAYVAFGAGLNALAIAVVSLWRAELPGVDEEPLGWTDGGL